MRPSTRSNSTPKKETCPTAPVRVGPGHSSQTCHTAAAGPGPPQSQGFFRISGPCPVCRGRHGRHPSLRPLPRPKPRQLHKNLKCASLRVDNGIPCARGEGSPAKSAALTVTSTCSSTGRRQGLHPPRPGPGTCTRTSPSSRPISSPRWVPDPRRARDSGNPQGNPVWEDPAHQACLPHLEAPKGRPAGEVSVPSPPM